MMAQWVNNMNVEALAKTREDVARGEFPEVKVFSEGGEWIFTDEGQFRGTIEFPGGTLTLVSDQPPPTGGRGKAPNPIQYCAFAVAACYATTLVTIASAEGIKINSLKVRANVEVNMKAVTEIEEGPVTKGVNLEVEISAEAPPEKLQQLKEAADQKCPAAYTIQNVVPFSSTLKIKPS